MRQLGLALAIALAPTIASAELFDINVGSDSVRLAINGPLSRLMPVQDGQYDFGLVSRQSDSNDGDVLQGHAGVLLTGDAGSRQANVTAGLGVRLLAVDLEANSTTGGAVALGGQVEVRLPAYNRIGMSAYGYAAPSATAFGEIDRYFELGTSIDYQVLRQAAIYIGYRNIKYAGDNTGTKTVDTGLHGGLRLNF